MESFSPLLIFPFPCGSKPLSSGSHDAFGHQSSPEVSLVLEGLESISGQARSSQPLGVGGSLQGGVGEWGGDRELSGENH